MTGGRAALALAVLCPGAALAAGPPNVGEVWSEISLEARVADDVKVQGTQNFRLGTGEGGIAEILTDLGVAYRLTKKADLGMAYRFGRKTEGDDPYEFSHRLVLDGKVEADATKWLELDNRLRYQVRLPAAGKAMRHVVRTRVRASIDTDTKIEPRLAAELFLNLGDNDGEGDGIGVPKARFDAGIRYGRKHWDFDVGYRLEEPIRDRTDARRHVLFVALSTEMDLRKDD